MEARTLSIVGCARCHGDGHADLRFESLDHPVEAGMDKEGDLIVFEWWAPCPTNGQPILLAVKETA